MLKTILSFFGLTVTEKAKMVANTNRKFGADPHYWKVKFITNTSDDYLLFTEEEIKIAFDRAKKNPEDL
jgi:hypothetical protein